MDTSKDYYESVMRDFKTYGRGRSLEQYCRDEAIDFKWIEKAKERAARARCPLLPTHAYLRVRPVPVYIRFQFQLNCRVEKYR